jgi:hypothetical protein
MPAKRDRWVVRDHTGLLHTAQLLRQYSDDDEDMLLAIQVATGCAPMVKRYELPQPHHVLRPEDVPTVWHGGFTIVEWRVRENPTCLGCIVVSEGFK